MAILPQIGSGQRVGTQVDQQGSSRSWIWYAVGAVIGLGLIVLFFRSNSSSTGSSATGTPLTTNPTATGGDLSNLTGAINALTMGVSSNGVPVVSPAPANPFADFLVVRGGDTAAWARHGSSGSWFSLGGQFLSNTFQQNMDSTGHFTITGIGLDNAPWINTFDPVAQTWGGWSRTPGNVKV